MPYHVAKSSGCPSSKPWAVIKNSDGKIMGCHASKADAENQLAAIHANEGNSTMTTPVTFAPVMPGMPVTGEGYDQQLPMMNGTRWEGILAVEGVPTGDGRQFAANSLTWADTPLPLRWNMTDSHGGMPQTTTVLVGRIDQVYRNPDNPLQIMGNGVFDDQGTNGAEALRLVQGQFLKGLSIDPDDISESDIEYVYAEDAEDPNGLDGLFGPAPEMMIFHAGRIRATTLVDTPAFVEAQLWLPDTGQPQTSGPVGGMSTHFGVLSDRQWNGPAHENRLPRRMTTDTARRAFAHVHNDGADLEHTSARFLHHEIAEGGDIGVANLTACSAGIRTINAGRAATLSPSEREAAYAHLASHIRAAGLIPPPFEDGTSLVASGVEFPDRPPLDWFLDPHFDALTPLTITDEGRIFGHGAEWNTCHTGFANACVTPPAEPNGEHVYFRTGEVVCAGGERVAVGAITLGTGHASTRGLSPQQAIEHYDNTGTQIALVASGEDDFGIWVAGAIKPGTPMSRVDTLRAAGQLSGDWRRIGGALRLVAFLGVNHPGFPVPRLTTFVAHNKQLSLVAAGMVPQGRRVVAKPGAEAALRRLARSVGRDPESRMRELRMRVKGS